MSDVPSECMLRQMEQRAIIMQSTGGCFTNRFRRHKKSRGYTKSVQPWLLKCSIFCSIKFSGMSSRFERQEIQR